MDNNYIKSLFSYVDGKLYWNERRGTAKKDSRAGTEKKCGYRYIQIDGKAYPEHWIVWILHGNKIPTETVDHINREKWDNRIENLRLATRSQQQINMGITSSNTSGERGVHWKKDKNRWCATVYKDGKSHYGGVFTNKDDAIVAVRRLREKLYGDF